MSLVLLGVNHRTAPVEVRERLAIHPSRLAEAMQRLQQYPGVEECMILSTCNRVELLANTPAGSQPLRNFLQEYFPVSVSDFDAHLYEYSDREAVAHLFRVACSLDSLVVGEPQILGQVKEAYALGRAAGTVQGHLDAALTRSFAVAKRVRTETAVGTSAVSVASVAVDLAKKIFGSLKGRSVYLVGAGKMSELAARHLMSNGADAVFVSNRTHDRAAQLAGKFGGQAIRFDELYANCDRADIVITSTGAPHAIFKREHGEMFLQRRKNEPMFFIDIAVPRDVDPSMHALENIFVYDIDDLQQVVAANTSDRSKEARRAEEIVAAEVRRFFDRMDQREVVPTIVSLQETLETIRQAEIDRMRGRLGKLTPDQESAIETLTKGIINKVLHTPITQLKSAAREAEANTVVETIRRLFNLRGVHAKASHAESEPEKEPTVSGVGR